MAIPNENTTRYLRRNQPVTLEQAAREAPILSKLMRQAGQTQLMLKQIEGLLPPSIHNSIQASPMEGQEWCLIVPNSAVAAKLRQLSPALAAHLRTKGHDVQSLRIRVASRSGYL